MGEVQQRVNKALDLPNRVQAVKNNPKLLAAIGAGVGLVVIGGMVILSRRGRVVKPKDLASALEYLQKAGVGITVQSPEKKGGFASMLVRGATAGATAAAPLLAKQVAEMIQNRAAQQQHQAENAP